MEILKTVDIYFEGTGHNWSKPIPYYMLGDDSKKFWVDIPDLPDVIKAFEFMGASNILGDLVELKPTFTDNQMDIAGVKDHNEQTFEVAVSAGAIQQNHYVNPMTTGNATAITWPGRKDVPAPTWRCTWTFWKPESAVMLKLAIPGAKCDTLK